MTEYNNYSDIGFWKNKLGDYQKYFSDDKFWDKTKKIASKTGKFLLGSAFTAYYCMMDPDTPAPVKAMFAAALGYLILPVDFVPDFIPGAGLLDDAGALTATIVMATASIKPEHADKAEQKVKELLG